MMKMEHVEMNAVFAMIGILGLLISIMLVRLITYGNSAKSYVLQRQAF